MKIPKFNMLMVALFLAAAIGIVSCGENATFTTLSVTPTNPKITIQGAPAVPAQFTATETLSDNSMTLNMTSLVIWSSSDTTKATIDSLGSATPRGVGTTTIKATDTTNNISNTDPVTLTVIDLPALSTVTVSPNPASVAAGNTQQFSAFWNSTTEDMTAHVTWSSSDTTKATISSTGLATAIAAGTTIIRAQDPVTHTVSADVILTVN